MLQNTRDLTIQLDGAAIPSYAGALELFERGVSSTLAPSNRSAWRWLEDRVQLQQHPSAALLELLVDPQTCGPLVGLQPGRRHSAHSERAMDSDRQRNSRPWVRSVACGSHRKPTCST